MKRIKMSEFDAVIDLGSNNLRISVFDSQSKEVFTHQKLKFT